MHIVLLLFMRKHRHILLFMDENASDVFSLPTRARAQTHTQTQRTYVHKWMWAVTTLMLFTDVHKSIACSPRNYLNNDVLNKDRKMRILSCLIMING